MTWEKRHLGQIQDSGTIEVTEEANDGGEDMRMMTTMTWRKERKSYIQTMSPIVKR